MRPDQVGPYSLETLRAAGPPAIFERSASVLKTRYVGFFEAATGRTLYDGQVETLIIETLAYAMSLLGEEAQATAEQHLVAFAAGAGLDGLGPNRSTPRLAASAAQVILRFSIAAPRPSQTIIPAGTRVRAAGAGGVFLTVAEAAIPTGATIVDVLAAADAAGASPNAIPAGALTVMLDPLAGVAVTNPAPPDGGADVESDDAYRLRLANALERISRAGPRDGYREAAMAVSPAIVDVAVVRPAPCYIDVYVLTANGPAGPALRGLVADALEPEASRPLGDELSVKAPSAVTVAPIITVRVLGGAAVVMPLAVSAVSAVFDLWRRQLQPLVSPLAVKDAVAHIAGVIDVDVTGLVFGRLAPAEYLDAAPTVVMETVDG